MQSSSNGSSDTTNEDEPTLWLKFLNGTSYNAKTTEFTFSINQTTNNQYLAKFTITFGEFYKETTLPASISNGRIYIDSIQTMFVVNSESLIDDNTIQIYQTQNFNLSGTVIHNIYHVTLIEDYRVLSKSVRGAYKLSDTELATGGPILYYEVKTGVLTGAAGNIRDILLNKVGISYIYGGVFDLIDYSENLNFTLKRPDIPLLNLIIIPIVAVIFVLVAKLAYGSLKRKKSSKRKSCLHKIQKTHLVQNTIEEGFVL